MSLRKSYDESLARLVEMVNRMGEMTFRANAEAMEALTRRDEEKARRVVEGDSAVNELERAIEHCCMGLLLRQQPVASDLRRVSAALKLVTDLERMGDEAKNIAGAVPFLAQYGKEGGLPAGVAEMAAAANDMGRQAVDAYVRMDMERVEQVIAADDKVDELFAAIKKELAERIAKDPAQVDSALEFLMIVRYLERLADHAVNVAEWTRFCITGLHKDRRIV